MGQHRVGGNREGSLRSFLVQMGRDLESRRRPVSPRGEQEGGLDVAGGRQARERVVVKRERKIGFSGPGAICPDQVFKALKVAECRVLLVHLRNDFLDESFEDKVFAHEASVSVPVRVENVRHLFGNTLVLLAYLP